VGVEKTLVLGEVCVEAGCEYGQHPEPKHDETEEKWV
jgi:hypothetical protein